MQSGCRRAGESHPLNGEGGFSVVQQLLASPFYVGVLRCKGRTGSLRASSARSPPPQVSVARAKGPGTRSPDDPGGTSGLTVGRRVGSVASPDPRRDLGSAAPQRTGACRTPTGSRPRIAADDLMSRGWASRCSARSSGPPGVAATRSRLPCGSRQQHVWQPCGTSTRQRRESGAELCTSLHPFAWRGERASAGRRLHVHPTAPSPAPIGAPGFEPGTSPTRTVRATRLRHAPRRTG
jgi:hypothetical protein